MHTPFWREIALALADVEVKVTARGSRHERPPPSTRGPTFRRDGLDAFTRAVVGAITPRKPPGQVRGNVSCQATG